MNTAMTLLTGGGLLALGGFAVALIEARRDKRRYLHEKEMTSEARRQERLDRAYMELGIYLSRYGDWARSVHPFMGPVPAPEPLPPSERWRIETLVTNHGSPEVRRLLDRWGEIARKIENADIVIRMAEQSRNPGKLDEEAHRERLALEDYRKAMGEVADEIRDRMHAELAGQTGPGPSAAPGSA